jgi:pimeloyl-ACP methyl ester carboxylesterase
MFGRSARSASCGLFEKSSIAPFNSSHAIYLKRQRILQIDGLQAQLAANRSQFHRDLPEGPFYGFNRPGVNASEAIIQNWWRQGMMGGAKAHYDGIVAFSQTDFTDDLKKITVPVLVMHGDDDQIVPSADSAPLSAKMLKNGTLKTYKGFPHYVPLRSSLRDVSYVLFPLSYVPFVSFPKLK